MADRLKIYACSGIGETDEKYSYWLDNTKTVSNTQAVNNLLAIINEAYAEVTYLRYLTNAQKIQLLNEIDLYCVALDAAKRFKDDNQKLYHAGEVIAVMLNDGSFEYDSLNNAERDQHLDDLIAKASDMYGDETINTDDVIFMDTWQAEVINLNKVGLSDGTQKEITKALKKVKVKGVSGKDYEEIPDLAKYLNDAADYFLYTFFTDEQLAKLPRVFKKKAEQQWKIYDYCLVLFTESCGNKSAMDRIIRAKLIERYSVTPEDVCQDIVNGKRSVSGIGQLSISAILTILTKVVVPIVLAIIGAIVGVVSKKYSEKYKAIDQIAIDGGIPSGEDFNGFDEGKTPFAPKKSSTSIILCVAALSALLFMNKK